MTLIYLPLRSSVWHPRKPAAFKSPGTSFRLVLRPVQRGRGYPQKLDKFDVYLSEQFYFPCLSTVALRYFLSRVNSGTLPQRLAVSPLIHYHSKFDHGQCGDLRGEYLCRINNEECFLEETN